MLAVDACRLPPRLTPAAHVTLDQAWDCSVPRHAARRLSRGGQVEAAFQMRLCGFADLGIGSGARGVYLPHHRCDRQRTERRNTRVNNNNKVIVLVVGAVVALFAVWMVVRMFVLSQYGFGASPIFHLGLAVGGGA